MVGHRRFELRFRRLRAGASPSKFVTHRKTHFTLTFTSDYPILSDLSYRIYYVAFCFRPDLLTESYGVLKYVYLWCLEWDSNPQNLDFESSTYTNSITRPKIWYLVTVTIRRICYVKAALYL